MANGAAVLRDKIRGGRAFERSNAIMKQPPFFMEPVDYPEPVEPVDYPEPVEPVDYPEPVESSQSPPVDPMPLQGEQQSPPHRVFRPEWSRSPAPVRGHTAIDPHPPGG